MKRTKQVLLTLTIQLLVVSCLLIFGAGNAQAELGAASSESAALIQSQIEPIKHYKVFRQSEYQTGGTGLRNQRRGGILINGVVPGGPMTPTAAFIYWAYNSTVPGPVAAESRIWVQRQWPLPVSANVAIPGVLVGTGLDPCWAGGSINVYRGSIPLWTAVANNPASGNGFYRVQIKAGSTGSTSGEDPWVSSPPPNIEGASIVIIYQGTGTVSIYDSGLAGSTFIVAPLPGFAYTLILPLAAATSPMLWDTIGADGQSGGSRTDIMSLSDETTTIDGGLVSGPGAPDNDSDWNGNDSTPIPQLWDTQGHNITSLYDSDGDLDITIFSPTVGVGDCLTPVANIVRQ